jgi:hypothetical protein
MNFALCPFLTARQTHHTRWFFCCTMVEITLTTFYLDHGMLITSKDYYSSLNLHRLRTLLNEELDFDPSHVPKESPWPRYRAMLPERFNAMFSVKKVLGDGRCLFRSIAKAYHQHEKYHERVRATMCAWAEKHLLPEDSTHPLSSTWTLQERQELVRRLRNVKNPKSSADWGTNHMVWIAEYVYNIRTYIWVIPLPKENCRYSIDTYPHPFGPTGSARKVIHLLYNGVDHFDALEPNIMLPSHDCRVSSCPIFEDHCLALVEEDSTLFSDERDKFTKSHGHNDQLRLGRLFIF